MEVLCYLNEIWKDVPGYFGLYQVSNYGRIKSLGNATHKGEHILKPTKDKTTGYHRVSFSKNGAVKNYSVHRLVAVAFIPNPNNYPFVDHIIPVANGGNDAVTNLRWVTSKMNANNPISLKNSSKAQLSASDKKSKSMIGKNTKKLLQYDRSGNLLNTYPNIKYTCMKKGYNFKTIATAIHRGTTAYGYYWKSA